MRRTQNVCEITILDLSYVVTVKSTVEISQIFVAFSELYLWHHQANVEFGGKFKFCYFNFCAVPALLPGSQEPSLIILEIFVTSFLLCLEESQNTYLKKKKLKLVDSLIKKHIFTNTKTEQI